MSSAHGHGCDIRLATLQKTSPWKPQCGHLISYVGILSPLHHRKVRAVGRLLNHGPGISQAVRHAAAGQRVASGSPANAWLARLTWQAASQRAGRHLLLRVNSLNLRHSHKLRELRDESLLVDARVVDQNSQELL